MKDRLHHKQYGQGMTEYIIIVALIAIAAIGVYQLFGATLRSQTASAISEISANNQSGGNTINRTGAGAGNAANVNAALNNPTLLMGGKGHATGGGFFGSSSDSGSNAQGGTEVHHNMGEELLARGNIEERASVKKKNDKSYAADLFWLIVLVMIIMMLIFSFFVRQKRGQQAQPGEPVDYETAGTADNLNSQAIAPATVRTAPTAGGTSYTSRGKKIIH